MKKKLKTFKKEVEYGNNEPLFLAFLIFMSVYVTYLLTKNDPYAGLIVPIVAGITFIILLLVYFLTREVRFVEE